ncbi:MAG: glycosyltransferase [Acidimicrobiales bacterium]
MSTTVRPTLLFWCQHSVGLGHLVRSLALAEALQHDFEVVLLNGGPMPTGLTIPEGVEIVNLDPLGHDGGYELVSRSSQVDVETAKRRRVATILRALADRRPRVVLLELYPFGRKKFAFEMDPLLSAIDELGVEAPKVVCSVRDILVNQRRDQARHDERAALRSNEALDAILFHADPTFATLDESFRPRTPLRVPVYATGFVTAGASRPVARPAVDERADRVIVSVGGGMVGEPIVRAAVAAHAAVAAATGLETLIVAGPFLPTPEWDWLVDQAERSCRLHVIRQVDDLASEIAGSAVSVSQCGYNTTMDLLRAGTPAVVVPYSEGREDEQRRRALRLQELGIVHTVDPDELTPERLTAAIVTAAGSPPPTVSLDLDGATASARIVAELAGIDAPLGERKGLLTP